MLTLTPTTFCIADAQQEFTLFNNSQSKMYGRIMSQNYTAYIYPTGVFEIQALQQYNFTIKVALARQTCESDRITIHYGQTADLSTPKIIYLNLTSSSVTLDQIRSYSNQLDAKHLQEELQRLKEELRKAKKEAHDVESYGMRSREEESTIDYSISQLNIQLGKELRDWRQRVQRAVRAFYNQGFWLLMFALGLAVGLKW